jgi:hypothetical protein
VLVNLVIRIDLDASVKICYLIRHYGHHKKQERDKIRVYYYRIAAEDTCALILAVPFVVLTVYFKREYCCCSTIPGTIVEKFSDRSTIYSKMANNIAKGNKVEVEVENTCYGGYLLSHFKSFVTDMNQTSRLAFEERLSRRQIATESNHQIYMV